MTLSKNRRLFYDLSSKVYSTSATCRDKAFRKHSRLRDTPDYHVERGGQNPGA